MEGDPDSEIQRISMKVFMMSILVEKGEEWRISSAENSVEGAGHEFREFKVV